MYRLRISGGKRANEITNLSPGRTYIIGRGSEANLRFPEDPYMSRAHAQLLPTEGGGWLVKNLSQHGFLVGGQLNKEDRPLKPSDVMLVGSTLIIFEILDPASRQPKSFPATSRITGLTQPLATAQPIPLPGQTNRVDLTDASWAIDGFPLGTLRLRDNLTVFQQGGFDLTLLGSAANACSLPTALTVSKTAAGTPFFRLDGALEFGVPPEVLGNTNGGRVFLRTCGFLSGGPDSAPQIALNDLALGGTFRLGGAQGLLIDNGLLSLEGLTNLYAASESKPFIVRLSGNVNVPAGPRLGLQDARFTFTGAPAPRFTLAGFSVAQNPNEQSGKPDVLVVTVETGDIRGIFGGLIRLVDARGWSIHRASIETLDDRAWDRVTDAAGLPRGAARGA